MDEFANEHADNRDPFGVVGPSTDRDAGGRFVSGNKAALVVGGRSAAFWNAHQQALRDIRQAVIADAGFTEQDAPCALVLAAEGIAQSALLRDSAFERLVESNGPMTSSGRTRRSFVVWQATVDRLERHLRLVGLRRAPKPAMSIAEFLAAASDRVRAPNEETED